MFFFDLYRCVCGLAVVLGFMLSRIIIFIIIIIYVLIEVGRFRERELFYRVSGGFYGGGRV